MEENSICNLYDFAIEYLNQEFVAKKDNGSIIGSITFQLYVGENFDETAGVVKSLRQITLLNGAYYEMKILEIRPSPDDPLWVKFLYRDKIFWVYLD